MFLSILKNICMIFAFVMITILIKERVVTWKERKKEGTSEQNRKIRSHIVIFRDFFLHFNMTKMYKCDTRNGTIFMESEKRKPRKR